MQSNRQQQNQQYWSKYEVIEPTGRDDDNVRGSKSKEEEEEQSMNYDEEYTNTPPLDQYASYYEALSPWPLSSPAGGAASTPLPPSPITSKVLTSPPPLPPGVDSGAWYCLPTGAPSGEVPLTREEQATDTSYMSLLSQRNPAATASIDGKIQEPHLNDILCGRGGSINSHPGNRMFRGWVAKRKGSYMLADAKSDKTKITSMIFEQVQSLTPPGRFLQKVVEGGKGKNADPYNVNGWWEEIDDTKALAKISQALREGAPAYRAIHGKDKKKKKQQQARPSPRSSSTRRNKPRKRRSVDMEDTKMEEPWEVSPGDKRKDHPEMEMELPSAGEVPPMPSLPSLGLPTTATINNGRELDVLFPTNNNTFATQNGNGSNLLGYPLVHMEDFTRPMNDVARAVPTPQSSPIANKKPRASVWPPEPATASAATTTTAQQPSGAYTAPKGFSVPNTPLVSPGLSAGFSPFKSPWFDVNSPTLNSPYGEAKAAWDAVGFELPNLTPSPNLRKPPLRIHSLSFSDGDEQSLNSSFEDPFASDSNGNKKQPPYPPDLDEPLDDDKAAWSAAYAPSLPLTAPIGGRIAPLPKISSRRSSTSRNGNHLSRRESSASSKSSFSITNHRSRTKRRSIS